jgi:hypothetical protein
VVGDLVLGKDLLDDSGLKIGPVEDRDVLVLITLIPDQFLDIVDQV